MTSTPAGSRAIARWLTLSVLSAAAHVAGLYCLWHQLGGPVRALQLQLGFWLAASGLWFLGVVTLRSILASHDGPQPGNRARTRWLWGVLIALGLTMRLPALSLPVTHSQDIYRYIWDGAVQRAGLNPYLAPPADPRYSALQSEQPDAFARINHRHLPTIYPPMAQLAFRTAASLGQTGEPLVAAIGRWKLLCGVAELGLLLALAALLRQRGQPVLWLALWLLCPLPAIELWLNGHVDGLGLFFVALALLGWPQGQADNVAATTPPDSTPKPDTAPLPLRQRAAEIGGAVAWLLACLVKPLSLVLLPGLRGWTRRRLARWASAALLASVVVWLPYREAGLQVTPSMGEYGRRWRSNDGAFAILQSVSEGVVAVAYRPPYWAPWRLPRLARLVTGRDRGTVWPDELAGFVARGLSALPCLALLWLCWRRRVPAHRTALLLLTGYALFTPVLHPWYLLWPLLLIPLWPLAGWPVIALCALAPLAYLPLIGELLGQAHQESIAPRLIEHGAAWLMVAGIARTLRRELQPRTD